MLLSSESTIAAVRTDAGLPRALGFVEQAFRAMSTRHPNHFAMVAEVAGATTPAAWADAFAAVRRRHPMLGVRISDEKAMPVFVPAASEIAVRVAASGTSWQREVAEELRTPFDEAGPLVRAVLLCEAERATVILVAFHAVADALSLVTVLRDLVRHLAGEPLGDTRPSRPIESFLHDQLEQARGAAATMTPPPLPPPARFRAPGNSPPSVDAIAFSVEDTARLRSLAHRHTATVHAALAIATLDAVRALDRTRATVKLANLISLRRAAPAISDDVGLYIGPAITPLGPRTQAPWAAARSFKQTLSALEAPAALARTHTVLAGATAACPSLDAVAHVLGTAIAHDVIVSNLGPLDVAPAHGPLRITALWGPSIVMGYAGEQSIGALTFAGALHLVHTSLEPLPGLLAHIAEQIRASFLVG